ncbi:MAG: ABC transporter permease [Alphaproteobacteria bacterium]|nr:ABC transporter permease [Alphaproteobacteria bacterium]
MIGLPVAWLGVFFLGPLATAIAVSFASVADGAPPFRLDAPSLAAWHVVAGDGLYLAAFLTSLRIAATVTAIAVIIAYPMAYAIARAPEQRRPLLLLLVMLPFWTSFLVRIYAWTALLRPTGVINEALIALGLIAEPLPLIDNEFAVHLGLVYVFLPFVVLPLYATIEKLDPGLEEAAADLGARPWASFVTVTLPLTWPGLAAGALLVFIPASAEFIVPELLGGSDANLIGRLLWNEFFANRDWPAAAALAIVLIVVLGGPILLFQRLEARS